MKCIYSIILMLLVNFCAFSQHKIEYNFLGRSSPFTYPPNSRKYVKLNEPSSFVIKDVNTFMYDVKVKGDNLSFHSEPPEVFQLFFDTEKFAKPNNKTNVLALAQVVGSIANEVTVYNDALQKLEFAKELYDNMVMLIYTDDKTQADIISEISSLDPNNVIILASPSVNSRASILRQCQTLYSNVELRYKDVVTSYNALSAAQKVSFVNEFTDVEVKHGKLKNYDYKELFNKIATLYERINNKDVFTVTSSPLFATKDQITYEVEITPKKDLKVGSPRREEKFNVPLPVKGGAKIDFSTGLFFTFSPELSDRSYRLDDIPGSELKSIQENSISNKFVPSIGAMMHVSPRWLSWIKPCFSLGLGVKSTNLEDASYFIGLGFIMGQQERVIISGGFAGSRVSYLKSSYSVGQSVPSDTKVEDLTDKTFRLAGPFVNGLGFFSITYNLTSKKTE